MSCFVHIDKGIPNMLAQQNCGITSIPSSSIPSLFEAVSNYERHHGVLTRFSMFGTDPLAEREDPIRRRDHLFQKKILILISYLLTSCLQMGRCFCMLY